MSISITIKQFVTNNSHECQEKNAMAKMLINTNKNHSNRYENTDGNLVAENAERIEVLSEKHQRLAERILLLQQKCATLDGKVTNLKNKPNTVTRGEFTCGFGSNFRLSSGTNVNDFLKG